MTSCGLVPVVLQVECSDGCQEGPEAASASKAVQLGTREQAAVRHIKAHQLDGRSLPQHKVCSLRVCMVVAAGSARSGRPQHA